MEWKKAKVSDLIEEFERGISYSSDDIRNTNGVPMVNLACIDKTGFYRDGELKYYTGKYSEADKVYHGDMLIACTDLTRNADIVGTPILVPADNDFYLFTMDLAKMTPKKCINKMYLYYALKTNVYRQYIKPWATGTNVLHLDLKGVYDYELYYPNNIEVQTKIATVLSHLDKKIELNRKINLNLEALARLVYNYWFVQFDFPDANGKPYKSSGGKMVYNEKLKREIPEGWEVMKIEDILGRVKTTPKLVTDEYLENGKYPIIDQTVDVYFAGFTDREDAVLHQYPVVVFGDHSCAVKYVDFPFVRGADGTQILISNDKRISTEYLYFAVQDIKMIEGYARHFSFLKESLIIVPEQSVATAFKDMAQNWFKSITQHRFESLSLTRQRDELLPLLMNGQVTIK